MRRLILFQFVAILFLAFKFFSLDREASDQLDMVNKVAMANYKRAYFTGCRTASGKECKEKAHEYYLEVKKIGAYGDNIANDRIRNVGN